MHTEIEFNAPSTEQSHMATIKLTDLKYNPREIDRKWQERWARDQLYRVDDGDRRPKWYELTMYPYPSGNLHIGHWYAMAPSDAHARFRRMQGYNVLHPMGFDAFGLPAENAAIQRGIHPYVWTMGNIDNMRRQLKSMGSVYDWDREVICCLPEYYRWNQWFFLELYRAGLAYREKAPANWCPSCQTVLANEQVVEGKCERCDSPVARRDLDQWRFRITKYADELLDQSKLDWPAKIKLMQTNWIGRSDGVEIGFDISEYGLPEREIRTFTTRIDTIFGVTFVVMAPEHPLVEKLTTPEHRTEVAAYVDQALRQTEVERLSTEKAKTGVFTGAYCVNRLNGERAPILVGDYVLMGYGTGIVMGVPRPRPAGLRVRPEVRPAHSHGHPASRLGGRRAHGGIRRRGRTGQLKPVRRHTQRRGQGTHCRLHRGPGLGQEGRLLSHPRLAHIPPALLGHPHTPSSTATAVGRCQCRRMTCRCCFLRTPSSSPPGSRP